MSLSSFLRWLKEAFFSNFILAASLLLTVTSMFKSKKSLKSNFHGSWPSLSLQTISRITSDGFAIDPRIALATTPSKTIASASGQSCKMFYRLSISREYMHVKYECEFFDNEIYLLDKYSCILHLQQSLQGITFIVYTSAPRGTWSKKSPLCSSHRLDTLLPAACSTEGAPSSTWRRESLLAQYELITCNWTMPWKCLNSISRRVWQVCFYE